MTTISILNGDFQIEFEDEGVAPGLRKVSRASGASATIYTTNQLYSAVADAADDFVAMGFRNPMLPTTPNAYTMENQYFIPRSSTQYLKEGSITADYSLTATPDTNGNGVLKVKYMVDTGDTDFVTADIGTLITSTNAGTDTGVLLDFDTDQDGTKVAWIRPVDSTPVSGDIFDGAASKPTISSTGTGSVTQVVDGVAGDHIFSAIQAIGSVPTATEVYVVQNRRKVQSWDGTFQWWATDPNVSLGIISILMPVKDSGSFIADGDLEVFARRYTSLYDNFRLRVQGGGFSALPLASAADINNTTGYGTTNLSSSTGTWTVGNGIYQGGTWATASAKGVITGGDNLGTADPDVEYYLVGDLSDFATGATTIKEYDFATAADADASATNVDSIGTNLGGPTDTASGEGGTVTVALGGFSVDHTGANGNEDYSVQVNCQSNVAIAKVYERLKYITRRGANEADLFGTTGQYGPAFDGVTGVDDVNEEIDLTGHEYAAGDKVLYDNASGGADIGGLTDGGTYYVGPGTVGAAADTIHVYSTYADALHDTNKINLTDGGAGNHTLTKFVNIPGETYRGLDGQFEYDASTGTLREGENIFTTTGGNTWTGRLLHQNTTGTGEGNPGSDTYITTTDSQTSIDTLADNDVVEDAFGTDDVTLHSAGSLGFTTFTSPKSSPFGTFTGTQIFGARGVSFINFDGADVQAYILTDDYGILRNPPNTISFTVTNTAALDRVLVARDTGVDGIIDKDQFGGLDTPATTYNGLADLEIRVAGSIDAEVPQAGYVRVVETTLLQEHHYVYDSRTVGTNGVFTLRAVDDDGSVTSASSTQLIDTSANFNSPQVEVGMLVRNTFAGKTTHVWEVTNVVNSTTLDVTRLYGPLDATQDWDVGDTFTINALIGRHTVPQDYATSDNVYDLILDLEASGTSVSNSFTQSTNFDVVVNVRQGKVILPFTVNQAVSSSNVTVTTVRQPDNIAT
jgi:hypothetical protein